MSKIHATHALPVTVGGRIGPYIAIARPDHWCKNVFMLLGVALACFYHPELLRWSTLAGIGWEAP